MGKSQNIPYGQRTDLEKLRSQWVKLTGLHGREEWSAAVVRAATAAELAVNFAIRREFEKQGSQLSAASVDELLKKANGLHGKLNRLLLPLLKGQSSHQSVKTLSKLAMNRDGINNKRNAIIHSGEFCNEAPASKLIADCQTFIHGIVHLYDSDFTLSLEDPRGTSPLPSPPLVAEGR